MTRPQTTPKQRALHYSEFGTDVAASIRDAIHALKPDDYEELFIYAERINLCNARQNQWWATDLHNQHGEAYDGSGRFWNCGHKHCQWCLKRHVNRCRKLTHEAIDRQKLFVGEHWTFLTLTIPNHGGEILERRELINAAWAIFRKSAWWRRRIVGAAKNEELAMTKEGHHYHLHLIARTKYIDYNGFRRAWTNAVVQAFEDLGVKLIINTSDGMCVANAKRIGSLSEAVNEVCKYFTKATSWRQMQQSQLLNSCRIIRWPRMFELVGSFKPDTSDEEAATAADCMDNTILDERSISDERKSKPWRRQAAAVGAVDYLLKLRQDWERQCEFRAVQLKRKYTAAKFYTLRGPPLTDPADLMKRFEALRPSKLIGPRPYTESRVLRDGTLETWRTL